MNVDVLNLFWTVGGVHKAPARRSIIVLVEIVCTGMVELKPDASF